MTAEPIDEDKALATASKEAQAEAPIVPPALDEVITPEPALIHAPAPTSASARLGETAPTSDSDAVDEKAPIGKVALTTGAAPIDGLAPISESTPSNSPAPISANAASPASGPTPASGPIPSSGPIPTSAGTPSGATIPSSAAPTQRSATEVTPQVERLTRAAKVAPFVGLAFFLALVVALVVELETWTAVPFVLLFYGALLSAITSTAVTYALRTLAPSVQVGDNAQTARRLLWIIVIIGALWFWVPSLMGPVVGKLVRLVSSIR